MIPFSPPRIDDKTIAAVEAVLRSGWITTGPQTKRFETELAQYLGVSKVACFNSWTNAAELALRWFGVGPGDEVIVPAYTYAASANIICHLGATPVLADSDGDCNTSLAAIKQVYTERTKAIIPVDIGGLPADTRKIREWLSEQPFYPASENQQILGRALLLSDGAHSLGSKIDDTHACHYADITGYSFHAVKNLTTAEGGALAFNLPEVFDAEETYRWFMTMSLHGQTKDALAKTNSGSWKYDILSPGYKCNMTDIQAAIGLVELQRYESETLPRRKAICERYRAGFEKHDWAVLRDAPKGMRSCEHLFLLRIENASENERDQIIEKITEREVSVNVHFMPLPLLSAYRNMGFEAHQYPEAMRFYKNEISLPVYYDLTDQQVDMVIQAVVEAVNETLS